MSSRARPRPPLVLLAFGGFVLLLLVGSMVSPTPALQTTVDDAALQSETTDQRWWVARLTASKESASSAYRAVQGLWPLTDGEDALADDAGKPPTNAQPDTPSVLITTPSQPASPPPAPQDAPFAALGFNGDPSLPDCERTLLYRFHGKRGFASEYLRFARTAAVAERFGYEMFLEEEHGGWMYGSVKDYFLPPLNRTCRHPPSAPEYSARKRTLPSRSEVLPDSSSDADPRLEPDRTANAERYTVQALDRPAWTAEAHVADGYHILYISSLFTAQFFPSPSSLRALHVAEIAAYPPPLPLPASGTVPPELDGAFAAMASVARRWWRVDERVAAGVHALAEEKLGGKAVGLHLRLGDKCLETGNSKYSPIRFATRPQYAALLREGRVRNRGKADECAAPPLDAERGAPLKGEEAGVLARAVRVAAGRDEGAAEVEVMAMSDDPTGVRKLAEVWEAEGLEMQDVRLRDLAEDAARLGLDEDAEGDGDGDGLLAKGFSAVKFRLAPVETRVALTRMFIRDLTLLAQHADALVLSQASNVGRLLTLLAGVDMVHEGKVHSIDVRWFPTAYYL